MDSFYSLKLEAKKKLTMVTMSTQNSVFESSYIVYPGVMLRCTVKCKVV